MGGWCKNREKCQHYFANHKIIVERLCGEKEEPEPVKETKLAIDFKIGLHHAKMG